MQLVLLTDTGSSAPGPDISRVDFCNARAFPRNLSAFPRSPISPPLREANSSSPEGGDPEGPSSYRVTSLGLFQL